MLLVKLEQPGSIEELEWYHILAYAINIHF